MLAKAVTRSLAAVAVISALGLASDPASATSQTNTATATILSQITMTKTSDLAFASIAPASAGGAVLLTPASLISGPPGFAFAGSPTAAAFNVTGAPGEPIVVTFSTSDKLSGPGADMTLGSYTAASGGGAVPAVFPAGGSFTLNVGATLTVNSNQTPGSYSGSYTVTVDY